MSFHLRPGRQLNSLVFANARPPGQDKMIRVDENALLPLAESLPEVMRVGALLTFRSINEHTNFS
jgi:hypothetical protein